MPARAKALLDGYVGVFNTLVAPGFNDPGASVRGCQPVAQVADRVADHVAICPHLNTTLAAVRVEGYR